ncbi:putative polypeptide N-acetylgalactosaminyltransferase 11 [Drosophila elegans]|uniref:putative polypeptide N-acetylgalactosaminyltransferase 11 n=1 Tax=Drosophila elegans TaxID=30023 RepID=UPI0007E7ECCC|nr:putative polypeptide N-acetylgalactosaminyltransferase 11 [Drosophila elegans]
MKALRIKTLCTCAIFGLVYCSISISIWLMYTDNLSDATVDFEYFAIQNLGDQGKDAHLQMTKKDLMVAEQKFALYQFNAWLSERIPLNRTLGDYRDAGCRNISYSSERKVTASIIIANQQEHPQTLLRTINSINAQSSSNIDYEIILVYDGMADIDVFRYIASNFPMVIQLKVENSKGLIHARLAGARKATGNVLVFLNSHMEVTRGWLSPLLEPIFFNKRAVTQPVMDGISSETFGYQRMPEPEQMAFDWQLERIWLPLDMYSLKNLPKPFASSLLEGRVFAIDSNWFRHLGGWDDGLRNTGGDALELSLKVWQCGGRILTIPCSRVGLIYKRDETMAQTAPNRNHNKQVRKNFKRVVDVWFDEYKLHFYRYNPRLRNLSSESLDGPRDLRRRLNCKSFGWYRSQVAPPYRNHYLHAGLSNYAVGKIIPFVAPNYCLAIRAGIPIMRKCNSTKYEDWTLTSRCQLKHGQMCLDVDSKNNVKVSKCTKKIPDHPWQYDYQHRSFVSIGNKCLQIGYKTVELSLRACDDNVTQQRWMFTGVTDTSLDHTMEVCLSIKD